MRRRFAFCKFCFTEFPARGGNYSSYSGYPRLSTSYRFDDTDMATRDLPSAHQHINKTLFIVTEDPVVDHNIISIDSPQVLKV